MTTITVVSNPNINVPIKVIPNVGPKGADGEGIVSNNENVIHGIENPTIVDSIVAGEWRMVKYLLSIAKPELNLYYATEFTILIDGTDVSISEYGMIDNDGDIGTVDVSKNGINIEVKVTPNNAVKPVTVRFARIGLKA